MEVDADDVGLEFSERLDGMLCVGVVDDVADETLDEGSGATRGVHGDGVLRVGDQLLDDGFRQPARGVVLTHLAALFGGDGVLVEDGG